MNDALRCSREALAQHGILGRDTDGAGIQVTDAHQDAAHGHQRRRRKAELIRAQQCRDDHVTTGLQAAVRLDPDSPAQVVEHQRLLGFSQADLPG